MAKLLPPYIYPDSKSGGERMIFNMFKTDAFAEDWIVLHSLNLSQHTKRLYGEIDFLLLIPNAGIFVLEVKGGDVRCTNGVWEFIDRHGNINRNKSPFNQARDAMFSLKEGIKKEFGNSHRFNNIQCGFFVAFPQVHFDIHSVEYEQWQIFDKANYTSGREAFFTNLVSQFTKKHKNQNWFSPSQSLPKKADLEEICTFLRGDFERVRTAKERISEFSDQVKMYTSEQFRILDSIQINDRSVIQGSAGTGKTMIAIESAIRAASEGKKVFLTCFNRIIGEWMESQLVNRKDNIVVSSLHAYLFELLKGFDYDSSHANRDDFYSKYLPELAKSAFNANIYKRFDKIIIDEGQDLIRKEYLDLFDAMLNGGLAKSNWEIYGDFERQSIYSQLSKTQMFELLSGRSTYSNFLLKINCRNTREIGEETSLISGFEKPPFLLQHLQGIPVDYNFYKDTKHQVQLANQWLSKALHEGIPLAELIILSGKKLESTCLGSCYEHSVKELRTMGDITASQQHFAFSTIQSYKGMESNYVLITDIEDLSSELAQSILYIGMSRARYGLTLLLSENVRNQYNTILNGNMMK